MRSGSAGSTRTSAGESRLWGQRTARERLEFAVAFTTYAAVHVGFLLSPYAAWFAVLWMVPQRLGVMVTAYCFARIQHPEGTDWSRAPLQSTAVITTAPHALARILLLGQNDHHIHHLLPKVPWYRYHRVWALGGGLLRGQALPERGVFRDFDARYLSAVRTEWPVRVVSVRPVARDVKAYTFVSTTGSPLPAFGAGAHIRLHLPSGRIRPYSLCGDPDERGRYQIAVKREENGRGGSKEVHAVLQPGTTLTISAPDNHFPLAPHVSHAVLVAGGIGITPLLSMAGGGWRGGPPRRRPHRDAATGPHVRVRVAGVLGAPSAGPVGPSTIKPGTVRG